MILSIIKFHSFLSFFYLIKAWGERLNKSIEEDRLSDFLSQEKGQKAKNCH